MIKLHKISIPFVFVFLFFYCSFPIKSELKTTSGKVTHREIYTSGSGSSKKYHIVLKYIYEVDGKRYESNKIWYMRIFYSTLEAAEKSIESYQFEKPITVYYRQTDPKESYLDVDDE